MAGGPTQQAQQGYIARLAQGAQKPEPFITGSIPGIPSSKGDDSGLPMASTSPQPTFQKADPGWTGLPKTGPGYVASNLSGKGGAVGK